MSSAPIAAALVVEACEKYLGARRSRIAIQRDNMVDRRLRASRRGLEGWLRRLLGLEKTRESIRESLEGNLWSPYMLLDLNGGAAPVIIEELLELARIAVPLGTSVQVDAETAKILQGYWPWPELLPSS